MKEKIKHFIPVGAGLFTVWIANAQLEAFHGKLNKVCYKTDPYGTYGDCNFDSSLLFFTCLLAGVGVGMLTHYFVVKEHK
ncbi:hypothetical protein HFO32_22265 [Rhizobium leguminosarum]|uniref:hypothetical protein n=1 Tax=Rhizobiaceae TaxID=82115 RepID=UPI000FD6E382|nr:MULTISPECIES: hypothetical protein [Rhizobiaceae]MBY5684851.1 hypothetical protein [Rhizobium leguminosarum]RVL87651.1 hypothetical protein CN140_01590 [Sinorhizobium meliloti]